MKRGRIGDGTMVRCGVTCRGRVKPRQCVITALLIVTVMAGACTSNPAEKTASSSVRLRMPIDEQTASYLVGAQRAFEQRTYGMALSLLDSALQRAPELPDAFFLRGRVLTELNQPENAEAAFRRVTELDSQFQGAWFNLGNTLFRRQQYQEALHCYRKEHEVHPSSAVLVGIARAYEKLNQVDSARVTFQKAIEADVSNAEAHARLAALYERDGMLDEALNHAKQALKISPQDNNYRYLVGSLLLQRNQVEEAVRILEQVTERDPWHYGAHYALGRALVRLGREEEANRKLARADSVQARQSEVEHLRSLAKMNPDHLEPWLKLAEALRRVHRFNEAIEAYERIIFLNPVHPGLKTNLATLLLEAGDTARAVQTYRAVLKDHPNFTDAWLNLGVHYANAQQYEAARNAWEQVLIYDSGNETASAYIARLPAAD